MPEPIPTSKEAPPRASVHSFHELMQRRVQRILLVSSLYDSFIMSEEGQLDETLLSQFLDLNLTRVPDLVQVSSGARALELLERDAGFDLVIVSINLTGGVDAALLAQRLAEDGIDVPVVALAYSNRELHDFAAARDTSLLERVFLWQGDVRILLAIVKYVEDRLNVAHDTGELGVPAVIVVEDNVRYYSSFLPAIYAELFQHSQSLLSEDLNLSQRMMRMRARPKVLLCTSFEEAWSTFEAYSEDVLGIVSDFEFPRGGRLDIEAGPDLCARALAQRPDLRIVMQSSVPDNRRKAEELGASFLLKGSPHLLQDLRAILVERFGFGDFIFRLPDGSEVARAADLKSLAQTLPGVPAASIAYHAEHNHFSNWLKARTEFELASELRPVPLSAFKDTDHLREHLMARLESYRLGRHRTVIADFDRDRFEPSVGITRIGEGSLGGKARGVAFANQVLDSTGIDARFPEVDIYVPPAVVLGTSVFDAFLEYEWLRDLATRATSDADVERSFLEAPFPRGALQDLGHFLERVKHPLAVRSSSMLEDSLSQPFAGVYRTFMLPNNDIEHEVRWRQLAMAVKRVYASAFSQEAKGYLSMTSFRHEEEKMGVMIQQLVGRGYGERFYPDFSGVARSFSYYPEPGHAAEDGVVAVALGMGQAVVSGDPCLRFNPRHPRELVSFSSVQDALQNSQREFFALDLSRGGGQDADSGLRRYPLEVAEADGTLGWLGSTFSADNDVVVDGISRPGVRLVTFAQVLKHGSFPLAEILGELLARCADGAGVPVEIEFAGQLPRGGRRGSFAFLQLRPLALSQEQEVTEIGEVADAELICRSERVLGHGVIEDVFDLVVVDADSFERQKSVEAAQQVARFDAILRKQRRPYILIGVGRWGSSDPSLGIPVTWNQISGARAIVESGFRDFKVTPSQGSHFFQNLASSRVGYYTVNPDAGEGMLDWSWLGAQDASERAEFVRHVRLEAPAVVRMSGRSGRGVIFKPVSPS